MSDPRPPLISVIIPVLNEEDTIGNLLESPGLGSPRISSPGPEKRFEKIVVDGGSSDCTTQTARKTADIVLQVPGGRARQLNAGAAKAAGDIFWFLHADSTPPPRAFEAIMACMADPAIVGGAFRLGIASHRPVLRFISGAANLRTRLTGIPYGDQGIFIRRRIFEKLGGFPDFPLMEDLEICRRLKKAGRLQLLPETLYTSSRRWDQEGIGYTTIRNQIFVLLYFLGVSPARLVRWYRPLR